MYMKTIYTRICIFTKLICIFI